MSAASSILICPVVQLHTLPDMERDILRRFFTEHLVGMDRTHDKRWRSLVRDWFNAEPGEGFELLRKKERGGRFHRRHRVILQRLFDSQERFSNVDRMHDWLKVAVGFVDWHEGRKPGVMVPKPRSTAYDHCSEDEMREFHEAAVDYLRGERAQRYLWRHLNASRRQGMLDAVLSKPGEDQ